MAVLYDINKYQNRFLCGALLFKCNLVGFVLNLESRVNHAQVNYMDKYLWTLAHYTYIWIFPKVLKYTIVYVFALQFLFRKTHLSMTTHLYTKQSP